MGLTLKEAEKNLIKAQKEAQKAHKNVEKAREVYNQLLVSVGGKKKNIVKKKSIKTKVEKKKSIKSKATKKSIKRVSKSKSSKKQTRMRGGGGSDWLSTVNSRGNVAGTNNHWGVSGAKWFNQFEKSGDYISMSELRRGGYQLQESASHAPKVPTGFDSNAQSHLLFNSKGDLGTQRV